jgi:hypothetical protein
MKRTILALCFALAAVFVVSGTADVVLAGSPWISFLGD